MLKSNKVGAKTSYVTICFMEVSSKPEIYTAGKHTF